MNRFVALLRGINVGGKNTLAMADLRQLLVALGACNVRTYIQSGNIVFDFSRKSADSLAGQIRGALQASLDISPPVLVLSREAWLSAMAANPFQTASIDDKHLHFYFLWHAPHAPDLAGIKKNCCINETWKLLGQVFYLHAPAGIGKSKLASTAERLLGVQATARNFRTVRKLAELVDQ